MKQLLITTALLEAMTGALLMILPGLIAGLLLGAGELDAVALTVLRVTGAAMITLALACWFYREGDAGRNLVKALLFYNLVVSAVLIYGNLSLNVNGTGLWPATIGHLALFV